MNYLSFLGSCWNKGVITEAAVQTDAFPFIFCVFQDDSVAQATSGTTESIGSYNPFSSTEMVSSAAVTSSGYPEI